MRVRTYSVMNPAARNDAASSPPPTSHTRRWPSAAICRTTSAGAAAVNRTSGRAATNSRRVITQHGLPGWGHSPKVSACSYVRLPSMSASTVR